MISIQAQTASELVRRVLAGLTRDFLNDNSWPIAQWEASSPRGMPIREYRHAWYRLEDVTRCAAWLPTRKLNYQFMAAEFLWIFCGRDDVEMISYYNKNIAQFSDDGKTFFGAYGPRWRGQIEAVVENLRRDPNSRQGVVSIWRPEAIQPIHTTCGEGSECDDLNCLGVSRDVPCTLSMQYMIRNGRLEAGVVMRSSDAWLGLPYDIFNFSMLMRAVAAELNVQPGSLTMYIGSSHLYERNLEEAKRVLVQERARYDRNGDEPITRLVIPGPPGIECAGVTLAEEMIRNSDDPNDVILNEKAHDWLPLLSVLASRHPWKTMKVCVPWDALVYGR